MSADATLHIAAILLAAGGSRRLGRAKQLLAWRGVPLVRRAAEAALASGVDALWVVLGAQEKAVRGALAGLELHTCFNAQWRRGIGTSIATGVAAALDRTRRLDAVLLLPADQPHVDAELLAQLVVAARDGRRRVACAYAGTRGTPALFSGRRDLEHLRALSGDVGARALLVGPDVFTVPFEAAAVDVDTPADWEALQGDAEPA